jgi:hypothetical protein
MKIPQYSSLWQREVRRDFYDKEIIHKSPLSPLFQRGVSPEKSEALNFKS